jgi:hypothetical protein
MQVRNNPSPPPRPGTASSFYRPRGGGVQSCRTVLSYMWWYGVLRLEWLAVLANLTPSVRRGESCASLETVSRVAVWAPPT